MVPETDLPRIEYNAELFRVVEPNKKVLDVGCSTGSLGAQLKKKKNCFVVGIDREEKLAKEAAEVYDDVIVADVEKLDRLLYPSGFFDIIVFGDVLEHTVHPECVLKKFKPYLSSDGYILISLPNIAYWTVRIDLLFGIFEYGNKGILDKTHLHFYTLKTAKQMIEGSGFRVVYVGNYNRFLKVPGRIWKSLFAHQIIFKAIKADRN